VDFAFSDEQEQLRAVARDFLANAYPIADVARTADADEGWDPAGWKALVELGWLDAELGPLEHALLLEETAAALLPAPLFSTLALAMPAVDVTGRRLTYAWIEEGRPEDLRSAADVTSATLDDQDRVFGRKVLVPDAAIVDGFIVPVRTSDDVALVLVEAGHGVTVQTMPTIDSTRRLGTVVFDGCAGHQLARGAAAATTVDRIARHALVGAASEAVGVAQRALDIAVDHARAREQFGRPIGSYQAISHRIADVYARVQLARSLATWAAWNLAEGPQSANADAGMSAAAAKSLTTEAAVAACESAIQVLGGIGFTWDHPLHRYYKRAQWLDAFAGDGARQRAHIAAALLDRR
jgi:alkylation response protein AidB-like acyl-CoA dehydrogenase